jgi:hypothetical protein
MATNPFIQYRTNSYHKPYRGIPIARLEEFKAFRRYVQATTADSQGKTAWINWRYVFRGPRGKNFHGQCDAFTLKCNAHSFDVYHR